MKKKTIEGIPMWLELNSLGISSQLYNKGGREWGFMWILRKEASGVSCDVGANIGYCTLSLAKRCSTVYAFEPDARSRTILDKNVELNKLTNVHVCPHAVSKTNGFVHIDFTDKPNLTTVCSGKGEQIQCVSLDNYLDGKRVDFIKMDIEGGETDAILGAGKTIRAFFPKLLIEVHPQFYNEKNDFRAVLVELLNLGYEFKYVENAKDRMKEFVSCGYIPFKTFKQYSKRALFQNIPKDVVLDWACKMPDDGKKYIRSFFMEKQ